MNNKRWKTKADRLVLVFAPYYEDEVIAELFRDEEGDWRYTSELLNDENEYLCDAEICEHDAKLDLEEQIYNHYEDERNYYQELMCRFSGEY